MGQRCFSGLKPLHQLTDPPQQVLAAILWRLLLPSHDLLVDAHESEAKRRLGTKSRFSARMGGKPRKSPAMCARFYTHRTGRNPALFLGLRLFSVSRLTSRRSAVRSRHRP